MAGFQCPYCQMVVAYNRDTIRLRYSSFERINENSHEDHAASTIRLAYCRCPNCGKYTILVKGIGSEVQDVNTVLRPNSCAKRLPDYIPESIRNDYKEACAIVNLSPKASATLSRRCLQGIIRDYWNITKSSLYYEIDELKDKISADL